MKRRIPILLVVVAVAAAVYFFYHRPAQNVSAGNSLRLSGNIEAHESVVSFKVQGRVVDLPVEEGQWVEAEAVLARLEGDDLRQQAALDQAATGVRAAELQLAEAGARRQEVEAAQQVLRDAQADLEQKKLDFQRADTLFREKVGPEQARDQADTNLKRATAAVERAKENLSQLREGTRKEQIAIARANLKQAQERAELSKLNVDYTVLRAPKAGVVVVRHAELGEVVNPGTPVVTMADLDHVWLRAYLPETELGHVRWGQEAVIKTDTFHNKTYQGKVSFISSKAEFTPKTVQTSKERVTLVYRVKIDLENPKHELKPGMPADADIWLGQGDPPCLR